MARTKTLSELRSRLRQTADIVYETDYFPNTELNTYLNDAITDLWDMLIEAHGQEYFLDSLDFTTTAGEAVYPATTSFRGESGWLANAVYYSGSTTALNGSQTSTTRAVLVRLDALPGAIEYLFCDSSGSSAGWAFRTDSSNNLRFSMSNGVAVNSPLYALTSADVGKVMLIVGTLNGTTLRLYVNGTEVGAGTAWSGTFSSAVNPIALGAFVSGGVASDPAIAFTIIAASASDSKALSAAEVATLWEDTKEAGDLVAFDGEQSRWSVRSDLTEDLVGSVTLTRHGSPTSELVYDSTIPGEFYVLKSVVLAEGNNRCTLKPSNSITATSQQTTQGRPRRYRLRGTVKQHDGSYTPQVILYPPPDKEYEVTLSYIPHAPELGDDTDVFDFQNGWEEYVVTLAAIRCKQKQEEDTSVLQLRKEELRQRIINIAGNRSWSTSEAVIDVDDPFPRNRWEWDLG